MTRPDALDTPFVAIDLDVVERNLRRAQAYFDAHGIALRPHVKTHKIPELARLQIALGACGVTCQKLGEAETMADGGVDDLLVTFNIVGRSKLERLVALARRVRIAVVADSEAVVDGLSQAMSAAGLILPVLVECDTGAHRCGVADPIAAAGLAGAIDRAPGLAFAGLMTYPPKHQVATTRAWLAAALDALDRAGLPHGTVSVGGTPDMYTAHTLGVSTEHRPGTYIYSDRYMAEHGVGTLADCALTITATVVSRPAPDRAIVDAGSKTLSLDPMGLDGFGALLEYPAARLVALSEEHGHLDLSASPERPLVGDRVTIIPNHACAVSNLHDEIVATRGGAVERVFRVAARGRVR